MCTGVVNPLDHARVVEPSEIKEDLRRAFLAFLDREIEGVEARQAQRFEWCGFIDRFWKEGVELPTNHWDLDDVVRATRVVRTALEGRPVGWQFDQIIQAAHHLFDEHPRHLAIFANVLRDAGHAAVLERQDVTGTWKTKVNRLPALRAAHPGRFAPDLSLSKLLAFLFPASEPVFERLEKGCPTRPNFNFEDRAVRGRLLQADPLRDGVGPAHRPGGGSY